MLPPSNVSLLASLILMLALPSPSLNAADQDAIFVDGIVAVVGGEIITHSDLQEARVVLAADPSFQGTPEGDMDKEILQRLIEDHLISQEAVAQGIHIGDEELDKYINAWLAQNGVTEEILLQELSRQGLSWEEYRANMRKSMVQSRFIEYVISPKINITDAQVHSYYSREVSAVEKEDAAKVFVIFIDSTSLGDEAAQEKANSVYNTLTAGADFSETAKLSSDHPSAPDGGLLGTFKRGELFKTLDSVVFTLKEGEVSRPIATPQGYFIIQSDQMELSGTVPFDQAKVQIENILYGEEMERQMGLWVAKAKKDAHIEIMDAFASLKEATQ